MSRFEFGGHADPMPDIAIPDPHLSEHLPTQVLELADGVPFNKADWVSLGYTHYEVWCVGAAGGWGGGIFEDVSWPFIATLEHAPDDIWAARIAALAYYDSILSPPRNFYNDWIYMTVGSTVPLVLPYGYLSMSSPETSGRSGSGYSYDLSHYQSEEYFNPNHLMPVTTYRAPYFTQSPNAFGGAGGGGGLHVVSGRLDDLPDSVEVVVGKVGADAATGQIKANGLWVPPFPPPNPYDPAAAWDTRYPAVMPSYPTPNPGQDGGASTFGDDICQASGGKGGHAAVAWIDGVLMIDGRGGDGGVGGRSEAGGGAAGGLPEELVYNENLKRSGQDGTWDGTVGQGGGGGRGSTYAKPQSTPGIPGPGF